MLPCPGGPTSRGKDAFPPLPTHPRLRARPGQSPASASARLQSCLLRPPLHFLPAGPSHGHGQLRPRLPLPCGPRLLPAPLSSGPNPPAAAFKPRPNPRVRRARPRGPGLACLRPRPHTSPPGAGLPRTPGSQLRRASAPSGPSIWSTLPIPCPCLLGLLIVTWLGWAVPSLIFPTPTRPSSVLHCPRASVFKELITRDSPRRG